MAESIDTGEAHANYQMQKSVPLWEDGWGLNLSMLWRANGSYEGRRPERWLLTLGHHLVTGYEAYSRAIGPLAGLSPDPLERATWRHESDDNPFAADGLDYRRGDVIAYPHIAYFYASWLDGSSHDDAYAGWL